MSLTTAMLEGFMQELARPKPYPKRILLLPAAMYTQVSDADRSALEKAGYCRVVPAECPQNAKLDLN